MPYSASDLQKKYRLTLMNREQGLPRFMQITGLKLNIGQIPTYLRKLRGIMSYDPDARIDQIYPGECAGRAGCGFRQS